MTILEFADEYVDCLCQRFSKYIFFINTVCQSLVATCQVDVSFSGTERGDDVIFIQLARGSVPDV